MATTDISEYTSAILSQKKGETVRDAIINAVKVISGAVSGSRSASTLNGEPLTNFVVNYYDPNGDKPFAVSLNQTKANMKREVDKINYGDPTLARQTELGPYSKTGVNNNHYGTHSLDRLEVTRRDIYEAINEAWRNTPSGAHGSDEYLVLDSDPFEDYPHYISLIGSGEGYALRCSERTEPITENGTYTAEEGTGWTKVTVNVSDKNIGPHTATITADGTYAASSYGKDGFSFVNVQVPVVSPDDPSYNPENPYDQTSWYSGGGGSSVSTGSSVYFYRYSNEKYIYKVEGVLNGESVTYDGPTVMSDVAGEYFDHWEPEPKNVTHNMKCVAVFKAFERVKVSTGEIKDSWATIAANGGAPYNIGDWKVLDFGTVTVPIDGQDGEDRVAWKIGKMVMMKVAGPNASKGTASTWITEDVTRCPASSWIWREDTIKKIHNRRFDYQNDTTGYYDEYVIGFEDTDMYNFLNGKTPSGGSTTNNIYSNLPAALVSKIKNVTKKTVGLVVRGGQSEETKDIIYSVQYSNDQAKRITSGKHKIWIPSVGETFSKNFVTVDTNYYTSLAASKYFTVFDCQDDDYSDFYFNGVESPVETDWVWYDRTGVGGDYSYPWRSSASTSTKSSSARTAGIIFNRDMAYTYYTTSGSSLIPTSSKAIIDTVNDRQTCAIPMVSYHYNSYTDNHHMFVVAANGGSLTVGVKMVDDGYDFGRRTRQYYVEGNRKSTYQSTVSNGLYCHLGFCL